MEICADTMARELRGYGILRPFQQLMYRLPNHLQWPSRPTHINGRRERVLSDLHEFLALLVLEHRIGLGFGIRAAPRKTHDVADKECPGGVSVKPVLVYSDVDVDYVAILQRSAGRRNE